ncbi:hypothetical protein LXM94_01920 [Rhizobium sp. TRM95111]|uniref:hypothetical protein n=1 Tax=Rhizobium alarense TaxID=2846851 RepID=UPI001F2F67FA|nr:hypothetical protein [Rhizobium alarense]MCF3638728.1 hypothetical protein [Rhizobium alarense]
MTQTSRHIAPSSRTARSAVSNGSRLVQGVDGRSAPARRFRDLVYQFSTELGGDAVMSEPMRAMVRQAAAVAIEAERMQTAILLGEDVDTDELVRISNVLQRLMNGLKAKATIAKAGLRTSSSNSLRDKLLANKAAA